MKVWASRRREDGAALADALPVIEGASLLELLVVDVTLAGNRRPSKVARLQPISEQRILAQLSFPKLVALKGWTLALSGIEERKDGRDVRGTAQTWVCNFHVSESAAGWRVKDMYRGGVALPKSGLSQDSGSRGPLAVGGERSNALQRQTTCAELRSYQISTFPQKRLIDCDLVWMSDSSFELAGLRVNPAHDGRPEQLERAGWLCEVDVQERELTKAEARRLR